jgi:excisionase family DNA binding protein
MLSCRTDPAVTRYPDMDPENPEWLTTKQVALLLQVSEKKLKTDRAGEKGLPYVRLGGTTIRYRRSDVERHLELATIHPRNAT